MAKGIKRKIHKAHSAVSRLIAQDARNGGMYARGLASEGYNGGYRDALSDVLLALNGVTPNRNTWWEDDSATVKADSAGSVSSSD